MSLYLGGSLLYLSNLPTSMTPNTDSEKVKV